MITKLIILWCVIGAIDYVVFRYKTRAELNFNLVQDVIGLILASLMGPIPTLIGKK